MQSVIRGKAYVLGDNIDTDQIIPAQYLSFDPSKPEGVARRELDPSVARGLGWNPEVDLFSGMQQTWEWFLQTTPEHTTSQGAPA
jgi:3-isopropylmalate/(R)-2-methylmalate dehydratase small subunit